MATKIITTTEYIDDLDGAAAIGTVSFSFEGTAYEIDLSKKNKTAMQKAFKPYLDAARKVRPSRPRTHTARSTNTTAERTDLNDVRGWARSQGFTVSDRGRISTEVLEKYDTAH